MASRISYSVAGSCNEPNCTCRITGCSYDISIINAFSCMLFHLLELIGDYNVGAGEVFIVVLRSAIFLGTDFTGVTKAFQYGNNANEIC